MLSLPSWGSRKTPTIWVTGDKPLGFRRDALHNVKIVVEKHDDGYVAYPLGIDGVVVGEGDSYDEALADVKSALAVYAETFGGEALEAAGDVLAAYVSEAAIGA